MRRPKSISSLKIYIYIRSLKMCISRLKIYIFKLEIELV